MNQDEERCVADFLSAPFKDYKEAAREMRKKIITETYELDTLSAKRTLIGLEELIGKAKHLSNTEEAAHIVDALERGIVAIHSYCSEAGRDYLVEIGKD